MTIADPGVQASSRRPRSNGSPLASRTGPGAEDSDHRSLASLRLDGERRGEEAAGQAADEHPPIHHSII